MKINVDSTAHFQTWVEDKARMALTRYSPSIRAVNIVLTERVIHRLEVQICCADKEIVLVEATGASTDTALEEALHRAARQLERRSRLRPE